MRILKKQNQKKKTCYSYGSIQDKKRRRRRSLNKYNASNTNTNTKQHKNIICPQKFSVLENNGETLSFFSRLDSCIKKHRNVCIDFSDLKKITIDTLMYLIVQIRNLSLRGVLFNIKMTPPKDNNIRGFIETSGIFNFATKSKNNKFSQEKFEICIGNIADPDISAGICEFVSDDRTTTIQLYNLIMELLSNTEEHAYKKSQKKISNWYIFCQKQSNGTHQIVIMDSGRSIPSTIRKHTLREKIEISRDDSLLLLSTLKGELRSETKKAYRNRGLKQLLDLYNDHSIQNLEILSRKGKFPLRDRSQDQFDGTLIKFDF